MTSAPRSASGVDTPPGPSIEHSTTRSPESSRAPSGSERTVMSADLPSGFTLLGEGSRSLGLVGVTPQSDQFGGTGLARLGEAVLQCAPQSSFGGAQRRGRAL